MPMTPMQINSIINNNGGIDKLAVIVNDAGHTINFMNIDKSRVVFNEEIEALQYPARICECEEEVTAFLSFDSIADIRMIK